MLIPQKLADIFMEDIAIKYLDYYPFSEDPESFFSEARHHMENKFNISWSGGGTEGSCWDTDGPKEVTEEDQPEMIELDNFLQKYFPDSDISYDIKLKADIDTDYSSDWYGGQTSTHRRGISFYQIAEVLCSTLYKDEINYVDFETMLTEVSLEIVNMASDDYHKMTFRNHLEGTISSRNSIVKKIKI